MEKWPAERLTNVAHQNRWVVSVAPNVELRQVVHVKNMSEEVFFYVVSKTLWCWLMIFGVYTELYWYPIHPNMGLRGINILWEMGVMGNHDSHGSGRYRHAAGARPGGQCSKILVDLIQATETPGTYQGPTESCRFLTCYVVDSSSPSYFGENCPSFTHIPIVYCIMKIGKVPTNPAVKPQRSKRWRTDVRGLLGWQA